MTMKKLLESIRILKHSEVKNLIDDRIREFKETGNKSSNEIFMELCFCILTANFNAERCIEIQNQVGEDFLSLHKSELAERLKEVGYRYPNIRARYIVDARRYKDSLRDIKSFDVMSEVRGWLVKNVRGIGYKEASHFLRNIGYLEFAIIDFHIIDILSRNRLIVKPKTLTKKVYLEIEDLLRMIARRLNFSLAELDLYLWYIETGKILK